MRAKLDESGGVINNVSRKKGHGWVEVRWSKTWKVWTIGSKYADFYAKIWKFPILTRLSLCHIISHSTKRWKTDREGLRHRGCRARAGDSQFNVREAQETVPLLQSKFPISPDQDSQFEDAVIYLALHTIRLSVSLITCQDVSEFFANHARSSSLMNLLSLETET